MWRGILLLGLWLFTLPAQALTLVQRAGYSMGTVFKLQVYHEQEAEAAAAAEAALAEIRAEDLLLSDWNPDSQLSRAVAAAWPQPAEISAELHSALAQALSYAQLTQGAFDISVGPLLPLWGFRGGPRRIPSRQALTAAMRAVGYRKIQLLDQPPRLQLKQAGMALDFGALGKGRALDRAAAALKQRGIAVAALSCDSSSLFLGSPPGSSRGWPVAVRHPRDSEQVLHWLWLKDQGLSSSGDDQQFFEQEGVRYSHLLDPRSGWPVVQRGSLTVVAASAAEADALSTALLVLAPEQARQLARTRQLTALRLVPTGDSWQPQWLNLPAAE
jgi:thiamine biosynthesis lipoprotein